MVNENIDVILLKKPYRDFTLDFNSNGASTGYIQSLDSYTKESLQYLGDEWTDVSVIPGKPSTQRFKFRPIKKMRSYIVIKSGRHWDPKTTKYTGYVIVFE